MRLEEDEEASKAGLRVSEGMRWLGVGIRRTLGRSGLKGLGRGKRRKWWGKRGSRVGVRGMDGGRRGRGREIRREIKEEGRGQEEGERRRRTEEGEGEGSIDN